MLKHLYKQMVEEFIQNNLKSINPQQKTDCYDLPVYIHIPKCGGSFIRQGLSFLNQFYCMAFYGYSTENASTILVTSTNQQPFLIANVIKISDTDCTNLKNGDIIRLTTEEFLKVLSSKCYKVFALTITSIFVRDACESKLKLITQHLVNQQYNLIYFSSFRNPIERAKSLYYVHKKTKTLIPCLDLLKNPSKEEFSVFLSSHYSEPNWVSMYLSYIFNEYTHYTFNETVSLADTNFQLLKEHMLSNVRLFSLDDLSKSVSMLFADLYTLPIDNLLTNFETAFSEFNQFNKTDKINDFHITEVDNISIQTFKTNSCYDFALYELFCK